MIEKAYFALGCFWGPEEHFSKLFGVVKTRVGYSGGLKENPTYYSIGDHSETVEIEFDPKIISYKELLGHFFMEHDPEILQIPQYGSIIFYISENQRREALEAREAVEKNLGRAITTSVEPFFRFYPAEGYHQKYYEKIHSQERVRRNPI